ncbi:hypothetical protein BH23DEI1_BH23DEI1_11570 [soil metagenome]
MGNTKGIVRIVITAIITAIIAATVTACGSAPSPQVQAWIGTSTSGTSTHSFEVAAVLDGREWLGTYTLGSTPPFTGDVVAELADGVLTGQLIATASCAFDLNGTLTAEALEAAFTPTACPGGEAGTWSATPTSHTVGE